jgi:hypothetical protein
MFLGYLTDLQMRDPSPMEGFATSSSSMTPNTPPYQKENCFQNTLQRIHVITYFLCFEETWENLESQCSSPVTPCFSLCHPQADREEGVPRCEEDEHPANWIYLLWQSIIWGKLWFNISHLSCFKYPFLSLCWAFPNCIFSPAWEIASLVNYLL